MIKRPSYGHCPELEPMYREHSEGLQFVQHLRLSVKRGVAPARLKEYCIWYWQHHIKPHFFHEERLLIKFLDPDDEYVCTVLADHREIRNLIASLTHTVKPLHFLHLANLLEAHILFEEERFFPDVCKQVPAGVRSEIYQKLKLFPVNPGIWEDEFWYE